jgi:hypothetical protein
LHKERLKATRKTVDNNEPISLSARCNSPSKKFVAKSGENIHSPNFPKSSLMAHNFTFSNKRQHYERKSESCSSNI